jgi:hypothetical protein
VASQAAEFTFRDVEPAAMSRSVDELDASNILACLVRREDFVERSAGVSIQIVAHEDHVIVAGIAFVQQVGDFQRPVGVGSSGSGGRLTKARKRFREHENAGRLHPVARIRSPHARDALLWPESALAFPQSVAPAARPCR